MKSHLRLPVFFLTGFLCAFGMMCGSAPGAAAPGSPETSGRKATSGSQPSDSIASGPADEVVIPGPLRPFLRMAAISREVSPDEILPLLALNVFKRGYQKGKPTEFLLLVNSYLNQARELEALAGPQGVIHVSSCEQAKPLLSILGYRLRQPCGPDAALETANANKAFLTIDSGFPLASLEESLRSGKPFETPFSSTTVPVQFTEKDWLLNEKEAKWGLVDALLRDPSMARLYFALSRMDTETALFLRHSLGVKKLIADAPVLDFYGSHISVRNGRVLIPGGPASQSAWRNLVGANPSSPAEFVARLISKDDGWLGAYFDALSRVDPEHQAYFAAPRRLRRFYEAFRGKNTSPKPTRHTFRPDQGLFLLVTRLQLDRNGQPHVPGNLDVWKEIMRRKTHSKVIREWGSRARNWSNPDQLVEGMFGISREFSMEGPLYIYLSLSEIDRGRTPGRRLTGRTARLLAEKYSRFGDQYPTFAEFHQLNDASITRFLTVAENLDRIPDHLVRSDALGLFQANIGLWQILARQREIPAAALNNSWQKVVNPFASPRTSAQVFDAGKAAFTELVRAATGRSTISQDQFLALLAGPDQTTRQGRQMRSEIAGKMRQVMDDQRLVSLDTLLALGDGLNQMAMGDDVSETLLPLSRELREFEMPKPMFTNRERTEFAAGLYSNPHIVLQMRTDLTRVIRSPGSPADLRRARGLLTPFLRDTLVGLNYAYYEPPGAQMLHHNPIFVRSHDFSGGEYSGEVATAGEQTWRTSRLFGRGWTASGGAHLIGSLADLPYVLASVEQNFIVPRNVQSLIWEDLVPDLVTSAVLPRWWGVTRNELHAVALYQRAGEELLASAANDEKLRQTVVAILSNRMLPRRLEEMDLALRSGNQRGALEQVSPAETFYLAAQFRSRFSGENDSWGKAGRELNELAARLPEETSLRRLSVDFGVPHPALAQNYARELMNLKPPPSFMEYSSRLLAESWDSNNLYWARLADEMGYSPIMLNQLVPQLTRRMVEQTFATYEEDWPAVLRAMRQTGDEFRQRKIALGDKGGPAAGQ